MMARKGSGLVWLLLGLGIGGAVTLLYAPKAGRETRDCLLKGARDSGDYLKQKSRTTKEQVQVYADRGKRVVERGRTQWGNSVALVRRVIGERANKVSAAVDASRRAYNSSAKTTAEARKA